MEIDDDLTPEQHNAIAALLTNPTLAKAAVAAGVSDRTLRRWMKEPKFRDAFRAARREMFAQAIALSQHYTPLAVNVLAKVMTDPLSAGPSKVAAAATIMRFGRESIELDDLVERIEKLEGQGDTSEGESWRG